jgi:hypothetical protein
MSKVGHINVGLRAFRKPKEINRTMARMESDDGPVAATPALARARNTLLDEALAKIGIDQSSFRSFDDLPQRPIADPLLALKAPERLGDVDLNVSWLPSPPNL